MLKIQKFCSHVHTRWVDLGVRGPFTESGNSCCTLYYNLFHCVTKIAFQSASPSTALTKVSNGSKMLAKNKVKSKKKRAKQTRGAGKEKKGK